MLPLALPPAHHLLSTPIASYLDLLPPFLPPPLLPSLETVAGFPSGSRATISVHAYQLIGVSMRRESRSSSWTLSQLSLHMCTSISLKGSQALVPKVSGYGGPRGGRGRTR